jgi:hypothetical protein
MNLFTALVTELQSAETAGRTASELEDLLVGRGREIERQLLQDHLDLRGTGGPTGRDNDQVNPQKNFVTEVTVMTSDNTRIIDTDFYLLSEFNGFDR